MDDDEDEEGGGQGRAGAYCGSCGAGGGLALVNESRLSRPGSRRLPLKCPSPRHRAPMEMSQALGTNIALNLGSAAPCRALTQHDSH